MKNILNELVTSSKAASLLGVTLGALRYWEQQGLLVPHRTDGGHRRYRLGELSAFAERKRALQSLCDITELEGRGTT